MIVVISRAITPGMPVRALRQSVKRLKGKLSTVKTERSFSAPKAPMPEKAVNKKQLKKCLLLISKMSIIIKARARAVIIIMLEKFKPTTTFNLFLYKYSFEISLI